MKLGSLSLFGDKIRYRWKSEIDQEFGKKADTILSEINPIFYGNIILLLTSSFVFLGELYNINSREFIRAEYLFLVAIGIGLFWVWFTFRWFVRDAGSCLYGLTAFVASERANVE